MPLTFKKGESEAQNKGTIFREKHSEEQVDERRGVVTCTAMVSIWRQNHMGGSRIVYQVLHVTFTSRSLLQVDSSK